LKKVEKISFDCKKERNIWLKVRVEREILEMKERSKKRLRSYPK